MRDHEGDRVWHCVSHRGPTWLHQNCRGLGDQPWLSFLCKPWWPTERWGHLTKQASSSPSHSIFSLSSPSFLQGMLWKQRHALFQHLRHLTLDEDIPSRGFLWRLFQQWDCREPVVTALGPRGRWGSVRVGYLLGWGLGGGGRLSPGSRILSVSPWQFI